MKNIDSIKVKLSFSIFFAIAGIAGLDNENYLVGGLLILLSIKYIISIISEKKKAKNQKLKI